MHLVEPRLILGNVTSGSSDTGQPGFRMNCRKRKDINASQIFLADRSFLTHRCQRCPLSSEGGEETRRGGVMIVANEQGPNKDPLVHLQSELGALRADL